VALASGPTGVSSFEGAMTVLVLFILAAAWVGRRRAAALVEGG
jgi:hypothetical protein